MRLKPIHFLAVVVLHSATVQADPLYAKNLAPLSGLFGFPNQREARTLEAGKFADLVVLDRDYLTIPVDEVRDIKPVMTMVAGEVVYQAGD